MAATTAGIQRFLLRNPPPQGCARPPLSGRPRQAALLTIDPCRSGLASSSFWAPLNGRSGLRRGPTTGVQQARRESHEGEKPSTQRAEQQRRLRLLSLGWDATHLPSFRAGLRTPSLPPSFLLCPLASSPSSPFPQSFFLSVLLLPGSPSLLPSSLASLPLWDGSPAHILPSSRLASPRLASPRRPVLEARAALESAAASGLGLGCLQLCEAGPGLTWGPRA